MAYDLTQHHIKKFNDWLKASEQKSEMADYLGMFQGFKWVFTKLDITANLTDNLETTLFPKQELLNEILKKHFENKVNAYWNIGFASAIHWVLEELEIPIPETIDSI